jgi:hypothetical protein
MARTPSVRAGLALARETHALPRISPRITREIIRVYSCPFVVTFEKNMRVTRALILILIVQTCCIAMAQAQSPNMIGSWNIEITFGNGDKRSLRLDAQDAGKGTLLVVDPRLKVWGPGKPSEAKWTLSEGNSVTFTGPMEFMLGNVGRDAGTLEFKGKFGAPDLITGEVEFSPLVGDRPSKHGTFKATRAGG